MKSGGGGWYINSLNLSMMVKLKRFLKLLIQVIASQLLQESQWTAWDHGFCHFVHFSLYEESFGPVASSIWVSSTEKSEHHVRNVLLVRKERKRETFHMVSPQGTPSISTDSPTMKSHLQITYGWKVKNFCLIFHSLKRPRLFPFKLPW